MLGIEIPKNANTRWRIVAPAFDEVDSGCNSACDEDKNILAQAEDAIKTSKLTNQLKRKT